MKSIAAALALLALGTAPVLAAPAAEPMPDFGKALPAADVKAGERIAVQCAQCHDMTDSKLNQFGPPIWNVVNRPRATAPGFKYSVPMRAAHDPWTYERLFTYLRSPQLYVPGTPMSFSGIRNAKNRIAVIAYLRTLMDTPAPIPPPK